MSLCSRLKKLIDELLSKYYSGCPAWDDSRECVELSVRIDVLNDIYSIFCG